MSHFIVAPIRPPGGRAQVNGSMSVDDKVAKDCLKYYWVDEAQAQEYAKTLARKNPMVQFAVFQPAHIYETAEPKVIQKRMTEGGEIVLAKEE